MKHWTLVIVPVILTVCSVGFAEDKTDTPDLSVFPMPKQVCLLKDPPFTLSEKTQIVISPDSTELRQVAELLAGYLRPATGFDLHIVENEAIGSRKNIYLETTSTEPRQHSYWLTITPSSIKVNGKSCEAVFNGIQTVRQLFPPEIESKQKLTNIAWKAPSLRIVDVPDYNWRGFMLDSGRQYHTVEHLKKTLDWMAYLKLNVFHWHLTEGDGWRIEIKKYPKLTGVGSKIAKGLEQQGYYTQEQIREIVDYARKRYIHIMPEIDTPGHSLAALMSYPELTCFGKTPDKTAGKSPCIYCGGKEEVYTFLTNVLEEVCELFPYEYIHLGGDEAPKGNWKKCSHCQAKIKELGLKNEHELQIYMMNRLADFLKTKDRYAVCWDDVIAQPGPPMRDNVIVHWWNYRARKDKCVKLALQKQHKVILSPNYYTYLNFPVSPWRNYQQNRTFDIQTAYEKNPADLTETMKEQSHLILGISPCLWTDHNLTQDMLDIRTFPRIYALTELMWNVKPDKRQPFEQFYGNVKEQYKRLELMGHKIGPGTKNDR